MHPVSTYRRGHTYRARFRDHKAIIRDFRCGRNTRIARAIDAHLAHLVECARCNAIPDDRTLDWAANLDRYRTRQLVTWGLISDRLMAGRGDLDNLLTKWQDSLIARGRGEHYAKERRDRASIILKAANPSVGGVRDIDAEKILAVIDDWRRDNRRPGWRHGDRQISENTLAHFLSAVKGFTRWLARERYLGSDPLAVITVERRRTRELTHRSNAADRRALSLAEQATLVSGTPGLAHRFCQSGSERSLLYRTALATGLRAIHLRNLRVCDLAPGHLTPRQRSYSKRCSPKPIPADLEHDLRAHCNHKAPDTTIFRLPFKDILAQMVRRDAAELGIDTRGVDFHCLRHTFATTMAGMGLAVKDLATILDVTPLVAQRYYGHSFPADLQAAVARLSDAQAEALCEAQRSKTSIKQA